MEDDYTVRLLPPPDEPQLNVTWAEPEWPQPCADSGLRIATTFELSAPLRRAVAAARQSLCNLQTSDGHFSDTSQPAARSTAEVLLAAHWLGDFQQPLMDRLTQELLDLQRTDGGWSCRSGQPAHAGTSLLAYMALKHCGLTPDTEALTAARRFLIAAGGIEAADDWTLRYLALFGQIPYSACRAGGCHDLDNVAAERAWSDLARQRAVKQFAAGRGIGELLLNPPNRWHRRRRARKLGGKVKPVWRLLDRLRHAVWRSSGTTDVDSQPALTPHWRNTLWEAFAATLSPTSPSHDPIASHLAHLKARLNQSSGSPSVHLDAVQRPATAAAIEALTVAGLPVHSAPLRQALVALSSRAPDTVLEAAESLSALGRLTDGRGLDCEDVVPPELQIMRPDYAEGAAPNDLDGAATDDLDERQIQEHCEQLCSWLISRQQRDGSWDGSSYVTARVIDALSARGLAAGDRTVDPAVRYLRRTQQSNGSWCEAVHGDPSSTDGGMARVRGAIATTAPALAALSSAGLAYEDPAIVAAAHWISAHQQPGGGWGERPPNVLGYMAGEGPSRVGDTTLAVLGLSSAGPGHLEAVSAGIDFLLESELFDGDSPPITADSSTNSVATLSCALLALCGWAVRDHNSSGLDTAVKLCALQVSH